MHLVMPSHASDPHAPKMTVRGPLGLRAGACRPRSALHPSPFPGEAFRYARRVLHEREPERGRTELSVRAHSRAGERAEDGERAVHSPEVGTVARSGGPPAFEQRSRFLGESEAS